VTAVRTCQSVRFPTEPVRDLLARLARDRALTVSELARQLQLDRRTVQRVCARESLSLATADRLAVACGRHPCEIWPEW
jgi:plasmid maintenance system antidote protein VapI